MGRQLVGNGCLDQALEVPKLWHPSQGVLQPGPSSSPSCSTLFAALGHNEVDYEHGMFGILEQQKTPDIATAKEVT